MHVPLTRVCENILEEIWWTFYALVFWSSCFTLMSRDVVCVRTAIVEPFLLAFREYKYKVRLESFKTVFRNGQDTAMNFSQRSPQLTENTDSNVTSTFRRIPGKFSFQIC